MNQLSWNNMHNNIINQIIILYRFYDKHFFFIGENNFFFSIKIINFSYLCPGLVNLSLTINLLELSKPFLCWLM